MSAGGRVRKDHRASDKGAQEHQAGAARAAGFDALIKVLTVDDHPAVRAGLQAILRLEPGFVPAGEAVSAAEAVELARTVEADVALVDYHLPDTDGLVLCTRLKAQQPGTRVLIYSAYAGAALTVPALVAGADGLVDKAARAGELFDAIREVAKGAQSFPPISPTHLRSAAQRLDPADVPVFGMLLDGTVHSDIAATLGIGRNEVERRVLTMLGRLRAEPSTASPPAPRSNGV